MPASSLLRRTVEPALRGLRAYWPAFLGIQIFAFLCTAAFFMSPAAREVCEILMRWKIAGGFLFAAVANVVTGGVVPELLKWKLRPSHFSNPTTGELVHQFTMLAVLGVSVDLFYKLQNVLWQGMEGWPALLGKILVDQFAYTPLVALPFIVLWFLWREHGYDFAATRRAATCALVRRRVGEILVSNVIFWVPILIALYSLPTSLQFLLFLIVNAAWCILLIFIARSQVGDHSEESVRSAVEK